MSRLLKQALFVLPIIAIIAAPVVLHWKTKNTKHGADTVSASYPSTNSSDSKSTFLGFNPFSTSKKEKTDYSMPEPFANNAMHGMTYSMRKSMDPNTWIQMMTSMMNPHSASPFAMCASCHEEEDIARYQKQFGPMMQSMWGSYAAMMDPHAMGQMMNPTTMTQMMHQMMAMPMQMMMPMMGMNPHASLPVLPNNSIPNVMDPKEYEKWYHEQQKKTK